MNRSLDVLKECAFLWPIDVPEAEIIVVDDGHFDRLGLSSRTGKMGIPKWPRSPKS
jgi:hypothetical protein